MITKTLIVSLACAVANAAVLERQQQCLTGTLTSFAALSAIPAASSYCAQSFPIDAVTVTATATDFVSVTMTITHTVTTTTSTTTTDITSELSTETQTDTSTATSTSFATPPVVKRSKGRCNATKNYPTASITSTSSTSSSSTSTCTYDAQLLCDLASKSLEEQAKVCSCIQQAVTAILTASVTEAISVTEVATATVTTITLFTTTATSLKTTTTTTTAATTTIVVSGVCKQAVAECSANNECCSGTCGPAFLTQGNACCNPNGGYCDLNHPEMCCSGTCQSLRGRDGMCIVF